MAEGRQPKRREGNEIEFSRIVAFLVPSLAPFMWLALFFDPAARFASTGE